MALGLRRPFDERWSSMAGRVGCSRRSASRSPSVSCGRSSPTGASARRWSACSSSSRSSTRSAEQRLRRHRPLLPVPRPAGLCGRRRRSARFGGRASGSVRRLVVVALSTTATLYGIRETFPGTVSTDALATAFRTIVASSGSTATTGPATGSCGTTSRSSPRPTSPSAVPTGPWRSGRPETTMSPTSSTSPPTAEPTDHRLPRARRHRRGVRRRPVPRRDPEPQCAARLLPRPPV